MDIATLKQLIAYTNETIVEAKTLPMQFQCGDGVVYGHDYLSVIYFELGYFDLLETLTL